MTSHIMYEILKPFCVLENLAKESLLTSFLGDDNSPLARYHRQKAQCQ